MSGDNPTPQEEVYYSLEQAVEDLIETRNIWVSAGDGDLEKVKAYIAGGQSVNAQDDYGYTPLHAACSYSAHAVAQWLLSQGANASIKDSDGDTPLMYCEDARCADLLLAAGADIFATNNIGHIAYFFSVWEEREPMVAWFKAQYEARGIGLPPVPPNPDQVDVEELEGVEEQKEGDGMEEEEESDSTTANQL